MKALEALRDWPVDNVAAAVLSPDGAVGTQVHRYGDTARVFELASVTKLLVARAVLVAVEEGAIELDQPAGPPGSSIAHLLAHASGVAFDSRTVQAPPATERIYSSAGYEWLAEIVEQATGFAFPDYLHEAVCAPLGMTATVLHGPAGHGARSSVDDLAAFAAELLAPQLLSAETATAARQVAFGGIDGFVPGYGKHRPNDWGLGPELRGHKTPHWTAPANSPQTFGHFGQAGTFLWVDPALTAACVVLTDKPFGPWAKPLWSEFNETLVTGLRAVADR